MLREQISNILSILPSNTKICTSILEILNNSKTNIVESISIKGNYYSFANNTIYISGSSKNLKDENRGIVIAHECIHSVQNRYIQVFNTVISNMYLVIILLSFILFFFNIKIWKIVILLAGFNILLREILEIDAVKRSLGLFLKYFENEFGSKNIDVLKTYFVPKMKCAEVLYFIKIIIDKMLPIIVLMLINFLFFS